MRKHLRGNVSQRVRLPERGPTDNVRVGDTGDLLPEGLDRHLKHLGHFAERVHGLSHRAGLGVAPADLRAGVELRRASSAGSEPEAGLPRLAEERFVLADLALCHVLQRGEPLRGDVDHIAGKNVR
jgi:hypothetical protein